MPKRSKEEKIEMYRKKLQISENKSKRRRVIVYSDSSDSETSSQHNISPRLSPQEILQPQYDPPTQQVETENKENDFPSLDPEVLSDLGDAAIEVPKYGENIHQDLTQRWLPILKKGLDKDIKETFSKNIVIPKNCKLLRAPTLNPEIMAAVTDMGRARDKKVKVRQQQLGLGITAVNRAMTILLTTDTRKIDALKILSDACRIISDLHYQETQARINVITPGLDENFLNIVQNSERDETLFRCMLQEKIKASKAIERQGTQIKKIDPKPFSSQTVRATSSKDLRFQRNVRNPSRSFNRGGRGGQRKTYNASRRGHPQYYNNASKSWNKYQRAPLQPQ